MNWLGEEDEIRSGEDEVDRSGEDEVDRSGEDEVNRSGEDEAGSDRQFLPVLRRRFPVFPAVCFRELHRGTGYRHPIDYSRCL